MTLWLSERLTAGPGGTWDTAHLHEYCQIAFVLLYLSFVYVANVVGWVIDKQTPTKDLVLIICQWAHVSKICSTALQRMTFSGYVPCPENTYSLLWNVVC